MIGGSRFFFFFVALLSSQAVIQLSCQTLHHCGVRVLSLSFLQRLEENERLEKSLKFIEHVSSLSRLPETTDKKGAKICLAILTVNRPQKYLLQSMASLLYQSSKSTADVRDQTVIAVVAGEEENNPDAEWLHRMTNIPFWKAPTKICGHDGAIQRSFYERKGEIFSFAVEMCKTRVAENGWIGLIEDDVISGPHVLDKLFQFLDPLDDVSLVKGFEPDEFDGWSVDNVADQLLFPAVATLIVLPFLRPPISSVGGYMAVLLIWFSWFLWIRLIPRQLWSVLLLSVSPLHLVPGTINHATQAVFVPKKHSASLQQSFCTESNGINQDLVMMAWAKSHGPTFHFSKSIFQHIGTSTSVKGAHQGWRLTDLSFGMEDMPKITPEIEKGT